MGSRMNYTLFERTTGNGARIVTQADTKMEIMAHTESAIPLQRWEDLTLRRADGARWGFDSESEAWYRLDD